MTSNSISPPTSNPPSGVHFQPSKSCRLHGRKSATLLDSLSTRMHFVMASIRYGSIIRGLTKSPILCWPLVCFSLIWWVYNLNSIQCFTLITSSRTSNFCGGGQKTRQPKSQQDILMPRIGRMKPERSSKRQ